MVGRTGVDSGTAKFITRAVAVLGGMAAIVIALILQLVAATGARVGLSATYLLLAVTPAATEEPLKQLGVLIVALKQPRWIRTKRDGLAVGALAGLSFGVAESLFYVIGGAGVERILSICMHIGASAVGGLGMFYASKRKYMSMLGWLGLAVVIHFLWNYIAITIAFVL
ncbi:MAG TPA: PrsW family intramembrane metalloprotease [Hadesarchaea archaeon]|nr:PrsW family intramembrane metalloprotease [Hadesarchaea archaeon]